MLDFRGPKEPEQVLENNEIGVAARLQARKRGTKLRISQKALVIAASRNRQDSSKQECGDQHRQAKQRHFCAGSCPAQAY